MKLPPGFPVKVDIPVLPTVSARVTFHDFEWRNDDPLPDSSFNIPEGYNEDPSRFPDLWHVDEVGMLTLEDRIPWVPQHKTRSMPWRSRPQHHDNITRALVDQDFDFAFEHDPDLSHLVTVSKNNFRGPHSNISVKPNEAEDLSSPASQSLIFYPGKSDFPATITPSVDFPFQFNFGSTYSSSITIYFDNWRLRLRKQRF